VRKQRGGGEKTDSFSSKARKIGKKVGRHTFKIEVKKAENIAKEGEKTRKKTAHIFYKQPRKMKTITRKNHPNRNKTFIFALDETHPSLFPSPCGVHIAQSRGTSLMNRRKRSLTL